MIDVDRARPDIDSITYILLIPQHQRAGPHEDI